MAAPFVQEPAGSLDRHMRDHRSPISGDEGANRGCPAPSHSTARGALKNLEPSGDGSPLRRSIMRRPRHRPKPLRVVLVTQGVKRGRLLNSLIDHTDPDRIQYSIITMLGGDGSLLDDMAARDIEVHSLGMSDGSLESVPLALIRLRRALKTSQPDVVHSLLFYPSLTSELSRAAWLGAPPSLLVRHHNALHHLYGRRLHARLDKWMACHATQVVAVSRTVAHTLAATEQVPPDHVTVIHNGLDWKRTVRVDPAAAARWRRRSAIAGSSWQQAASRARRTIRRSCEHLCASKVRSRMCCS